MPKSKIFTEKVYAVGNNDKPSVPIIRKKKDVRRMYEWDNVPKCTKERCTCFSICGNNGNSEDCVVFKVYLKNAIDTVVDNFGMDLDESKMYRVTMHLLPLYKQLCRLSIDEVGIESSMLECKGKVYVNPIYKEIRQVINEIEKTWLSIGLSHELMSQARATIRSTNAEFIENFVEGVNLYDIQEEN